MRNLLHSLAVFCALLVGMSSARAQTISNAESTRGYWLGASLGAAAVPPALHGPGALAGTIALDAQRGAWLTSARWHSVGLGIGGDVQSYSVLVGRATRGNGFAFSAISLGPTALWRRMCSTGCGLFNDTGRELGPTKSGVGVMLAGDAALRVWRSSGAGLGLTGYLDLNTARSFAGFGFELTLGKWR
ncbi:MAG TPA: hypothetical protein VF785_03290 [Gemmatimonadaceae bacterium]